MQWHVPIKYRNFPGPFATYRPNVARLKHQWVVIVMVLLGVVSAVAVAFIFEPSAAFLPAIAVGVMLPHLWQRRWRHRLVRHEWLLCLQCGYPLDQARPEARCSECGTSYTHASTRWGWRVMAGKWSSDMDPPPPPPMRD